uniref:Coiled-coil domain containing 187 n=1 Tax=Poecilia reticulata TaxID=8081 RepID=A0A3P9N6J7_POERE
FAVLEDGVLAHSLQEQEIEQYYTTNIQKNQLVQNDIRVARRLQHEEEQQRAQQSALFRQVSRQMEEQDFEYARVIQEELQRRAEEAHRREQDDEVRASLQPEPSEAGLDLGDLHQVLQDEELARKLQEEEDKQLRRTSLRSSYPEGDFRVAQVAQDEEIAHFMQKQEIKAKRRSRELEGPGSWHEHRAMMNHYDRTSHPAPFTPYRKEIKNIAEELDPTFQGRVFAFTLFVSITGQTSEALPTVQSGSQDLTLEEPTFIPPTKRQADKSGRSKPKEKREGCKQQ